MQILARAAATLVFGMAAFHGYGTLVVLYSLLSRREVEMQVFFIRGSSHQTLAEFMTMIMIIGFVLSVIPGILLCLTFGLWKQKIWAWWCSFVAIGFILLPHATEMQHLIPQAQVGHRYLLTYGILTLAVLLFSAPAFFKQTQATA